MTRWAQMDLIKSTVLYIAASPIHTEMCVTTPVRSMINLIIIIAEWVCGLFQTKPTFITMFYEMISQK